MLTINFIIKDTIRNSQMKNCIGQDLEKWGMKNAELSCSLINRDTKLSQHIRYSSTRKLHWAVVSRILIKVSLYRHAWLTKWPHDWTQFLAFPLPGGQSGPEFQCSSNVVVLSGDQYPSWSFLDALLESRYLHKSGISKCFLSSVPETKGQRQNIFYALTGFAQWIAHRPAD